MAHRGVMEDKGGKVSWVEEGNGGVYQLVFAALLCNKTPQPLGS